MTNHPNRGRRTLASTPKPAEVAAFLEAYGLTMAAGGELVHATTRAMQYWTTGERRMHAAVWHLAQILVERELIADALRLYIARGGMGPNVERRARLALRLFAEK